MDSFDEFEFKPITEGLGFHKKSPLKADEQEPLEADSDLLKEIKFVSKDDFLENPPAKKSREPKIHQPLPRPGDPTHLKKESLPSSVTGAIASASSALGAFSHAPSTITGVPKPTMRKPVLGPDTVKASETAQPKPTAPTYLEPKLVPIQMNLPALLIDSTVILALSILFLVALLVVTKVDLVAVMTNTRSDLTTQMSLVLLFVSVLQLYVISLRGFFGVTVGEWAFDSQLGTAAQQTSSTYPLLVLWRSLFILLTGVIVIPLLSVLCRRDLAAYVSGLSLFKRQD